MQEEVGKTGTPVPSHSLLNRSYSSSFRRTRTIAYAVRITYSGVITTSRSLRMERRLALFV